MRTRNSFCLIFSFLIIVAKPISIVQGPGHSFIFNFMTMSGRYFVRNYARFSLSAALLRRQNESVYKKRVLNELMNLTKVTSGFAGQEALPLTIRNGVGHFTLPLHRMTFIYSPHQADSRPLM